MSIWKSNTHKSNSNSCFLSPLTETAMKPIERTLVIIRTDYFLLATCRQTTETSRQLLLEEAKRAIGNNPDRLLLIGPAGLEDDFTPDEVNNALILAAQHNPKLDTLLSRIQIGYYCNENGTAQFKDEMLNHWPDPANEPVFSDLMKQHSDFPGDFV